MPAPTEERILTQVLETTDEGSKTNKNIELQKWVCLVLSIIAFAAVYFGYKYSFIPFKYLLFLSALSGMSLLGFHITMQAQYQLKILLPYLNVTAIQDRIDTLKSI
jgi:hypothetical protein